MNWENRKVPECIVKSFPRSGVEKTTRIWPGRAKSTRAEISHKLFMDHRLHRILDS